MRKSREILHSIAQVYFGIRLVTPLAWRQGIVGGRGRWKEVAGAEVARVTGNQIHNIFVVIYRRDFQPKFLAKIASKQIRNKSKILYTLHSTAHSPALAKRQMQEQTQEQNSGLRTSQILWPVSSFQ
jgi:hypothetical protein